MELESPLKYKVLLNEFHDEKYSANDELTKDQFCQFLDRKINGHFNRDISGQLLEKADTNHTGIISVKDFIRTYLEAEAILTQKIKAIEINLALLVQEKDAHNITLQEIEKNQSSTDFPRPINNSLLRVSILEAQKLMPLDWRTTNNSFVYLNCNGIHAQTKFSDTVNPKWGESFEFPINTGMETLLILIKDVSQNFNNNSLAHASIQINQIHDQEIHRDWIDLFDDHGDKLEGKLLIEFQWIFVSNEEAKKKTELEDQILVFHEDLENLEDDLAHLYLPFKGLLPMANENIRRKTLTLTTEGDEQKTSQLIQNEKNIFAKMKRRKEITLLILAGIYVFIIMGTFWNRAVFVDVLICSSFWVLYYLQKMDVKSMKYISGLTIFSWILDLAWVIIYTKYWWKGEDLSTTVQMEITLLRTVIIFSCLLLLIKISFGCCIIYILSNMKEEIYKLEDRTATLKESIFSEENQGIKKSDSKFFVNFNRESQKSNLPMCLKTQKSHRNCTIAIGICSLIFIILGVVLPIVLHKAILEMAKTNVIMTPGTSNLWGRVPGDTHMKIYRTFQFFNFQNPYEAIFLNETPIMQESLPYDYQEFQEFLNYSFYNLPNSSLEVVSYNFWDYMKKIDKGNESDMMTVANLPAFGAWYQLQISEKFLLSIQTMSQMIGGIESEIVDMALAQGISALFMSTKQQAIDLFTNCGISPSKANELWEDPLFGWKNATTLVNWVKATKEGLYNATTNMLKDYFHLSYTRLSPLLSNLKLNIDSVMTLIVNMYCVNKTNLTCDSKYLAALQWSQQGITMNPPGGLNASKSIISTNSTAEGFPEISYYYSDYFLQKIANDTPYLNMTFGVEWAYNLLARSGDPKKWLKSPHLMFHQGNLKFLFKQGAIFDESHDLKDLEPIRDQFLLKDLYQAHVFWKYMDYIVVDFALMTSQGGTKETLGLGAFSAQFFYSSFMDVKDFLLDDITSKSLYANLIDKSVDPNKICYVLFNNSMTNLNQSQLDSICYNDINLKNIDETAMLFLSDLCLNTLDPIWFDFMQRHGLTKINMFELCDPQVGYWGPLMNETNVMIKNFYNCSADAEYCSANEIAIKQWGQSTITLNPLPILKGRYYNSSFSVSNWNPTKFPKPIEFLGFLNLTKLNKSKEVTDKDRMGLNETISSTLLTFDCLFNAVMNAKAFIYYLNNDFQNFTKNFLVENPLLLLNYLRYVTLEFGFGGITVQRNVSDLLLGYDVPFVKMMGDTDPAMGGNPSINPKVGFCPNNTKENAFFNTQVMYTGNGDSSMVRKYHSVYGERNMVQFIPDFDGNETRNITKNPYRKLVPIKGTDGFTDRPNLNPDGDTFEVFVTMLMRYGTTYGLSNTKDYNGLEGYLYRMDNSLMNKNPDFYQDRWNGFLNFSSIMSAPVFNSKRHFLDVDEEIMSFIHLIDAQGENITANRDEDDIYLYVEPYTGLSLSAWLKLQTSVQLSNNLLFNSSYAMLPIFSIIRGGDIPDSTIDDLLGQLKMGILFQNVISRVICFVIGGILFLVAAILAYKYYKKAKKNRKEGILLDKNSTQI